MGVEYTGSLGSLRTKLHRSRIREILQWILGLSTRTCTVTCNVQEAIREAIREAIHVYTKNREQE